MTTKPQEAKITREIRQNHHFTLADRIGAEGGGFMKGASTVPPTVEAATAIRAMLERELRDAVLAAELMRPVEHNTALLDRHLERPLGALGEHLRALLATDGALEEFVRQVDASWGREMDERPHFQRHGQAPHPEDEYTHAGVRSTLERLLALTADG
ncbi:MAG: hypothetical protein JXX28_02880 [Deltaproteobacteria bacterium]|nr:hypothetical protein [Deltaproteobacteria bacterium]